jgi:hypothetical protein
MSFNTELTLILRHIIDDTDSTAYKYADSRLQELLHIAALLVKTEVSLGIDYTIDIDAPSITPDPTDTETRNDGYINLTVMKAACLLGTSESSTAAGQSIDIKDGQSSVGLKGIGAAKLNSAKNLCQIYADAKKSFVLGSNIPGHAIVSPFHTWYFHNENDWRHIWQR